VKKRINAPTVLGVLVTTAMVVLTGCSSAEVSATPTLADLSDVENLPDSLALATPVNDLTSVDNEGSTSIELDDLQSALAASSDLSTEEITGLLLMREEEKLAHDVYTVLYEAWNLRIFENIASSEQTHTDAVKALLDAYGILDPAAGEAIGEFVNADLQALYDELVTQGSQSLGEALKVGAAIEEIDILDLEEQLAHTDNADIRAVYENLMKGSRNHLRSFTSTLKQQTGEIYEPQYLSADVYQSIVGSAIETGSRGNRNRN
jgi:hypothetical protein